MTELNKYSLYNFGMAGADMLKKDKVDQWIDEIKDMVVYSEVKDFVQRNFGDVDGGQWFEYPELNKKVWLLNEKNNVEICMLKNGKQYYGRGWEPINKEE